MKKAFYFDVETTGLSAWKNDIIQIAYLIEINGEIALEKNLLVKPFNMSTVDPRALKVNRTTVEQIENYPLPRQVHNEIQEDLAIFVNKFDKADKFTPIGYNVKFDIDFLNQFFKKNNDKYYGSWFNWYSVDPKELLQLLRYEGKINLPDLKLTTACAHYNIKFDAHDALADIKATRELLQILRKELHAC